MLAFNEDELDRVFQALGDRTRRQMLKMLSKESLNVSELGGPFGMTKQAVSKHLKVLEDAGLVSKEKEGRVQHCRLNPETLEIVYRLVEEYQHFWDKQLDGLDQYIQSTIKEKGVGSGRKSKT